MTTSPLSPLNVIVDHVGSDSFVRIVGPLLIGAAWQVRELDTSDLTSHVVIDLAETTDIDIAGVAAVGALARSLSQAGVDVHIVSPPRGALTEPIEMTGVFDLINRQQSNTPDPATAH